MPQTPINSSSQAQSKLFKAAFGMGSGTMLSRLLGYLRDILIFSFFPKFVTDCFVAGFRLPNFFRRVLGEGALSVSFIPNYLELKTVDPEKAKILRNTVFSFLFSVSGILTVFGIVFMEAIMASVLPYGDFKTDPDKLNLAIQIGRWMFAYLFLVTQFAFSMSVLNAHKKFWIPGVAPAFFNFGFILCFFIPLNFLSFQGQQLSIGVLFGGLLQAGIVFWTYVKLVGLPKFNFSFNFKPFKRVLLATLPSVIGIGVLQLIGLINLSLGARAGEGSLSYLYIADRIIELPQSLIAVSIGTAMLPNLSELWIKSKDEFRDSVSKSIRLFLFLGMPSAVGVWFLAAPIVQMLFQRKEFTYLDVMAVTPLVKVYALLILVSGLARIILPIYYSFKNTWFPVINALIVVVFHWYVGSYLVETNGLEGVVYATLLSGCLSMTILSLGLKFFINSFLLADIFKSIFSFLIPNLLMGGGLFLLSKYLPEDKSIIQVTVLLVCILVSILIYFGSAKLLKISEADSVLSILKRRKNRI